MVDTGRLEKAPFEWFIGTGNAGDGEIWITMRIADEFISGLAEAAAFALILAIVIGGVGALRRRK
ncbi:hypothetical protein MO973_26525 [Paenibacillus sp. TRM 82003]|nr:hypothetical protein [Paenibacillus sp. TRM 82003]